MKILLDMNLSPDWCEPQRAAGHDPVHWSAIGAAGAPDREIMGWARDNGYIVFTHDLGFSAILAATNAKGPSVLQVRTQNPTPAHIGSKVNQVLERFESQFLAGAIVVVDETRARVRILPLRP